MKYKILLSVLIVLVAIGIVFFVRINQSDELISTDGIGAGSGGVITSQNDSAMGNLSGISSQVLAEHNNKDDCWIVYKNKVYDITSFLPKHPGGVQKIADHCGDTTFEAAFTKQHGTSKATMLMRVATFMGDFDVVGQVK